jgi:flagellar basal-body rod modification protein FlgD
MSSLPQIGASGLESQRASFFTTYGETQNTKATSQATEQTMNFLNLLITQMQNQDPMNPMDNSQMVSQLAQLTELQKLETLNSTLKDSVFSTQAAYASSLIGKTIAFIPDGGQDAQSGTVSDVEMIDGAVCVRVGANFVPVGNIVGISGSAPSTPGA